MSYDDYKATDCAEQEDEPRQPCCVCHPIEEGAMPCSADCSTIYIRVTAERIIRALYARCRYSLGIAKKYRGEKNANDDRVPAVVDQVKQLREEIRSYRQIVRRNAA